MGNEAIRAKSADAVGEFGLAPTSALSSYAAAVLRTSLPVLLTDLLALGASILAGARLLGGDLSVFSQTGPFVLLLAAAFPAMLAFAGLYPGIALNPAREFRQIILAASLSFATCAVAAQGVGSAAPSWSTLIVTWALTIVTVKGGRSYARMFFSRFGWWGLSVAVTGERDAANRTSESLQLNPHRGLRPLDWAGDRPPQPRYLAPDPAIHYVVFAVAQRSLVYHAAAIDRLLRRFPRVLVVSPDSNRFFGGLDPRVSQCGTLNGIELRDRLLSRSGRLVKRGVDLSLVALAAPALLLLTACVTLITRATSNGPIFYGHQRIGRGGSPFTAWKFRTMVADADRQLDLYFEKHPELREEWERTQKLRHDPRVTLIGNLLRRTSLDEAPQIWNVLCGEMSFIGPRPIVEDEIPRYGDSYKLYMRVIPGLTGLWQVSGRSRTTYERRVTLDEFYVRNWSIWLDLYILLRTIPVVLLGDGAR